MINKKMIFILFLFVLILPITANAFVQFIPLLLLTSAGVTTLLNSFGGDMFSGIFDMYSQCYSCKYISSIIDFTVISSNSIYRVFADYIMFLVPLILISYLVYKVFSLFLSRDVEKINIPNFYDIFIPKIVALGFAFILLSQPTPRLMFDYVINPTIAIASGIGSRLLEVGGGKEVSNSYLRCLADKDIGIGDYKSSKDNYFKSSKKNFMCIAKMSEEINATGITIGNILLAYSIDMKYNWLYVFPNLGMVLTGAIMTGAYFASSFIFTFAILEIFLSLYLVFALFPLAIMSWVLSRGTEPIPRISGFHEEIINLLTESLMSLMTICFFLGIAVLLSSSVWSSDLGGNAFSLIKQAIENKDPLFIINNVYIGSKSFFYLLISPIFMIFLIMQGKNLGVKLSENLRKSVWSVGQQTVSKGKEWYKWITTEDKAGKRGYDKIKAGASKSINFISKPFRRNP